MKELRLMSPMSRPRAPRAMTSAPIDITALQGLRSFASVADAVRAHGGEDGEGAVLCLFPRALRASARFFLDNFPGQFAYATKCNPHPVVLHHLYAEGLRDFDVASWSEVEQVRALGADAVAHFMNPVKARSAIARAYAAGVRSFALDCEAELNKITDATTVQGARARDLSLHVRLELAHASARLSLAGKFGVARADACELVRAARACAPKDMGFAFHIGSQAMEPAAFAQIFAYSRWLMDASGVAPDFINVGGGFPLAYPTMDAPPLADYMAVLRTSAAEHGLGDIPLWGEPGRALVGAGGATAARVELRKGDALYLNEGIFGSLFDAGTPAFQFPAKRVGKNSTTDTQAYKIFGPTCDSADVLAHRVRLPCDMAEGDWIEFGQLGAYGQVMKTSFNGFGSHMMALIDEPPLLER